MIVRPLLSDIDDHGKADEIMESMMEAHGPNRDKTCEYKGFFAGDGRTEIIF